MVLRAETKGGVRELGSAAVKRAGPVAPPPGREEARTEQIRRHRLSTVTPLVHVVHRRGQVSRGAARVMPLPTHARRGRMVAGAVPGLLA